MPITGINNTCLTANYSMDIKFSSKDNKYSNVVTCFILPNLTGNMPSSVTDITTLKVPKGITLADEEFNIPGRIDTLIGSDLYVGYSKINVWWVVKKQERKNILSYTKISYTIRLFLDMITL